MTATLHDHRRFYAEEISCVADIRTPGLFDAFASVPRERFLGAGPWRIATSDPRRPTAVLYRETPNNDPRHVYHNVAIALDAARQLNNGHPSTLAAWLDALALTPGAAFLHVGCGVGYYTALAANVVGSQGRVTAFEVDPLLAERARANLASLSQVSVIHADGLHGVETEAYDAAMVNAGVTLPSESLVSSLRPGGRVLVPITASMPQSEIGVGAMLRITRSPAEWPADYLSSVAIFNSPTGRNPQLEPAIRHALASGVFLRLKTLRRDAHDRHESCLVHGDTMCLSAASAR